MWSDWELEALRDCNGKEGEFKVKSRWDCYMALE